MKSEEKLHYLNCIAAGPTSHTRWRIRPPRAISLTYVLCNFSIIFVKLLCHYRVKNGACVQLESGQADSQNKCDNLKQWPTVHLSAQPIPVDRRIHDCDCVPSFFNINIVIFSECLPAGAPRRSTLVNVHFIQIYLPFACCMSCDALVPADTGHWLVCWPSETTRRMRAHSSNGRFSDSENKSRIIMNVNVLYNVKTKCTFIHTRPFSMQACCTGGSQCPCNRLASAVTSISLWRRLFVFRSNVC